MLPKGWKDVLLDDVAKRKSGHTPNKDYSEYWNGGIKWVSLADSSRLDKGLITQTDKEISVKGIEKSSAVLLPAGTVVLSRDAGVGKSAVLAEQMAVSQHFIAWDCNSSKELYNWYLYYWLQLKKPEFERIAVGSTIKTIGLPYFKRLRLKMPPIFEQRLIAQSLSVWDEAIVTSEQLLANCRKQKQALVERLTDGKKYSDEWSEFSLGELGVPFSGLSGKEGSDFGSGSSYIPYINVFKNHCIDINVLGLVRVAEGESQNRVLRGDILFTTSSETPNEVGMASVLQDDLADLFLNSFCFGYRLHNFNTLLPEYAGYLLRNQRTRIQFTKIAQGSTRFNISKNQTMRIKVLVPPMDEQMRIVSVLNQATETIAIMSQQIKKLRAEKSALLQQLLTGKHRVRVPKQTEAALT